MLDVNILKRKIEEGIRTLVVPAIKDMEQHRHPEETKLNNEQRKDVSEIFDEAVTESLADIIANSIDYYVKHIQIMGIIKVEGSPTIQHTNLDSWPLPILNGLLLNTLGIK